MAISPRTPSSYTPILSSPSKRGIACSTPLEFPLYIFWWPRKERGVHTQKPNAKYRTRDRPFIRRAGNLRSLSQVNHFYVSIILWAGRDVSLYFKKKKREERKELFFHQHPSFWSRFNLHNNLKSSACNVTYNRSEKSLYTFYKYRVSIKCKLALLNSITILFHVKLSLYIIDYIFRVWTKNVGWKRD